MTHVMRNMALRAAQVSYDNMCPPDDSARDTAIDALLSDKAWRAKQTPVADEWCDGMHDGAWYGLAERRLADLHELPDDKLIGSDLLAGLRRLAAVAAGMREEKLREIAVEAVDARREAGGGMEKRDDLDGVQRWSDNDEPRNWQCNLGVQPTVIRGGEAIGAEVFDGLGYDDNANNAPHPVVPDLESQE